jgi:aryl-alcohol dehydrogenase
MTIVAAVIETGGAPFRLESLELGPIQADEARVRIAACGICHTDLLIRGGSFPTPMPVVLGHEGAGVVEEVGAAVTRVAPGDRVVLSYASCGTCRTCATGRPYYCAEFGARNFGGARSDGTTALSRNGQPVHSHFFGQSSFATHAAVTERSLVRLPDDVPFEIAAPLGCGVQTGAGGVLNVLRPQAGAAIAVFGVGGVGLSAVMAAALTGCGTIVAVDVKPARLELARELGAGARAGRDARNRLERDGPGRGDRGADRRRGRRQPGDERRPVRPAPGDRVPGAGRDLRPHRRGRARHRGPARGGRDPQRRPHAPRHRRGP